MVPRFGSCVSPARRSWPMIGTEAGGAAATGRVVGIPPSDGQAIRATRTAIRIPAALPHHGIPCALAGFDLLCRAPHGAIHGGLLLPAVTSRCRWLSKHSSLCSARRTIPARRFGWWASRRIGRRAKSAVIDPLRLPVDGITREGSTSYWPLTLRLRSLPVWSAPGHRRWRRLVRSISWLRI